MEFVADIGLGLFLLTWHPEFYTGGLTGVITGISKGNGIRTAYRYGWLDLLSICNGRGASHEFSPAEGYGVFALIHMGHTM